MAKTTDADAKEVVPDSHPALPEVRATPGLADALVIGPYFCDLVFSGLDGLPQEGQEVWATACDVVPGGTFITASALSSLGISTGWVTTFGTDPFSGYVRSAAEARGIDASAFIEHAAELPNLSVALSFGHDRSFVSYAGDGGRGIPTAAIVNAIERLEPRVVVWAGLPPSGSSASFAAARQVGARIFVDPQSTTMTLKSEAFLGLLAEVDFFAPNAREICEITTQDELDTAIDLVAARTRFVLVKQGDRGATAAAGASRHTEPAMAVPAVETTGAGDCFNAGFLMAWLDGRNVASCLQAGNAAGGLSVAAASSLGVPSRTAVDAAIEKSYRSASS